MSLMVVKGGKTFAAEQKLRKLKKRIFRLKTLNKKVSKRISPYKIIKKSVDNMNSLPTAKYKQIPNEIENNTLSSQANRKRFNFSRLKKISQEKTKLERFHTKIYRRKKLKLRSLLGLREELLIFAARIRKKDSPGKFYKSSVDNKSYFNKKETFLIRNRQKIYQKYFY